MTASITDFGQFTSLRAAADRNDPAALREVAGQFEALFLQMMLKSMRAASFGDSLMGDSKQQEMYRDMMDQQLALDMSRGRGIGLAETLFRQLGGVEAERGMADDAQDGMPISASDRVRTSLPAADFVSRRPAAIGAAVQDAATPAREDEGAAGVSAAAPRTTAPADAAGARQWDSPEAFAQSVWPHVKRAAGRLNVSPVAVLAQAALETGWGAKVMPKPDGSSSLNLFGIKADQRWDGASVAKPTIEFSDGVARREVARFRAYEHVGQTFDDYADFLAGNPRYSRVMDSGGDAHGFAEALQRSGYATDPKYADKIKAIFDGPTMRRVLKGIASGGL